MLGLLEQEYDKIGFSAKINQIIAEYQNKKAILYGTGTFCNWLFENTDINDLNIIGATDKKYEEISNMKFRSISCFEPSELLNKDFEVLIITMFDAGKVPLFIKQSLEQKGIEIVEVVDKSTFWPYWVKKNYNVNLEKPNSAYLAIPEIFYCKVYDYEKYIKDMNDFVVYDMGANRGYATLYFANMEQCKKVYGFELCDIPYNIALRNIALNPDLAEKIEFFNMGLSDKNEETVLWMYPEQDYLSTIYTSLMSRRREEDNKELQKKTFALRKSSEVLKELFQKDSTELDKILKIDVEGAEFNILPDLYENNLLSQFKIIIGELHIMEDVKETRRLYKYMFNAGFVPVYITERPGSTLFLFVKDN